MKKLVLSFIAFVSMCSAIAQPTLTATGINPIMGETHTYASSAYVSPGTSGANQTWDLSSMSPTSSITYNFVSPSTTANGVSFPSSNMAWTNTTGVAYYNTSSSSWQNYGSYSNSNSVVMSYSDPEDLLHYPCQYNSTFTDSWGTQFTNGGYTFYRKGTTTVTADGYGTLITPTATYSNAMRIHFVEVYRDSATVGGSPYIINYTNDEYMWYKEGIHIQIAGVTSITYTGGTSTGGFYLTDAVGIEESPIQQLSSNLFPNPASDKISIDFSLTKNQNVDIRLINSMGQQVKTDYNTEGIQGNNIISLNIEDLPKGIYFIQLVVDENIAATKRFIKSSK